MALEYCRNPATLACIPTPPPLHNPLYENPAHETHAYAYAAPLRVHCLTATQFHTPTLDTTPTRTIAQSCPSVPALHAIYVVAVPFPPFATAYCAMLPRSKPTPVSASSCSIGSPVHHTAPRLLPLSPLDNAQLHRQLQRARHPFLVPDPAAEAIYSSSPSMQAGIPAALLDRPPTESARLCASLLLMHSVVPTALFSFCLPLFSQNSM
ncbi:hypothetical protein B0H19DRAFT_1272318 [Mycena capillaripes]|nr:hypothetical protein B0H19DRAFT_1272318 [Mycena capillaripes]